MNDKRSGLTRTILCPVDFSDSSIKTLKRIVTDFTRKNIELNMLHVQEAFPAASTSHKKHADDPFAVYSETLNLANCRYRLFVESGPPAETIISFARDLQPDLIAIGSHGKSALGCLVMGSTADAVMRYAPFPVLLYKAQLNVDRKVMQSGSPERTWRHCTFSERTLT